MTLCRMSHWTALGLSLLLALALPANARACAPQDVLIRGGWLFDSEAGLRVRNPGLVVRQGRILGPLAKLDASAPTLTLNNQQTVLPGFFDLHAHYNVNLFGKRRDETRVQPTVYLANGVTSTFTGGEYNPDEMRALEQRIAAGTQLGPRLYRAGPYFGTVRPDFNHDWTAEQVMAAVDEAVANGARSFKAKGIRGLQLEALIERAHHHGLTVTAHLDSGFRNSVNTADAIAMGIDRIEHFLGGEMTPPSAPAYTSLAAWTADTPGLEPAIQRFLDHQVVFDATLTAYGYFGTRGPLYDDWADETDFFTPYVQEEVARRDGWRQIRGFEEIFQNKQISLLALYLAGGHITTGTDHVSGGEYLPGFSIHREMHAMVTAGIPAAAVLQIATLQGARALGVSDRLGSLRIGKLADMVVIDGDPTEDITCTREVLWVIRGGVVHDSAALLDSVRGKLGPRNKEEAAAW